MGAFLDLARHSLAALRTARASEHGYVDHEPAATRESGVRDRYAAQRSARLRELEAAGKCLARSGKDTNLRYWPAERGSRVLAEHRRQRQPRGAARS